MNPYRVLSTRQTLPKSYLGWFLLKTNSVSLCLCACKIRISNGWFLNCSQRQSSLLNNCVLGDCDWCGPALTDQQQSRLFISLTPGSLKWDPRSLCAKRNWFGARVKRGTCLSPCLMKFHTQNIQMASA